MEPYLDRPVNLSHSARRPAAGETFEGRDWKTGELEWYCRAAAQGNADAMYQLGLGYATGKAVPEGVVEAFMWMHLDVLNGRSRSK